MDAERLNCPVPEWVFHGGDYEANGGMPVKLVEAIAWLQRHLNRVPAEYRGVTEIELDSEYESSCVGIQIRYPRPPTDEERHERLDAEQSRNAEYEARERRQYEALKAKYDLA